MPLRHSDADKASTLTISPQSKRAKLLMTSAPLAMHMHGHNQAASNLGMQWHVIAMYLPSFFTGKLIARFGAMRISAIGISLTALSAVIGFFGEGGYYFWGGVDCIGYWLEFWLFRRPCSPLPSS